MKSFLLFFFVASAGSVWASDIATTPLRTPAPGATNTLFASVPAATSGVDLVNRYEDPRMWTDLYQELVYGAIGSGVAVGDYDRDGWPDLFVTSKADGVKLYRNEQGSWRFTDVTRATLPWPAGDAWVQGATWTDVNNDGWLDLYVCRFNAANLLFINQRNGTFTEEGQARGLALVDASGMAAFADYDRDGWLDVYIQTNMASATASPDGQPDHLFRNQGNGTFTDVTKAAGIAGKTLGHAATWWDYDEDGWPDLYVSNDYGLPDQLYRNLGNGTFTDVIRDVVPRMPYYSMGADTGDVDNNGHLDLLATDMAASTPEKDQRGMAGSRSRAQLPPSRPGEPPQLMRNALYLNAGAGILREGATLAGMPATDWTWSPRWEDYDNDGWVDLLVTNGMIREYHNADLLQRIMGLEMQSGSRQIMKASPVLADRDLAFRNLGDLRFADTSDSWGWADQGVCFGSATGDFDGDGDLDLVRIRMGDTPELLRNTSTSGRRLVVSLVGKASNPLGIGAEVRIRTQAGTQLRVIGLSRGYLSSSEPIAHFGLGAAEQVDELSIRWPSGRVQTVRDIPAGQRLTVQETAATATPTPPSRPTPLFTAEVAETLTNQAPAVVEPGAQALLPWEFANRGPSLAAHRDVAGVAWLAIGGTRGTAAKILRAGTVVAELPVDKVLDDGPLAWIDADLDGDADLLVTKLGTARPAGTAAYQPTLWLNQNGTFAPAPTPLPTLTTSVGAVVVADFNRDGAPDLFLGGRNLPGRYPLPPRSAVWLNQSGAFVDATDTLAPELREIGLVTSALWTDPTQTGHFGLLLTNEWGTVRFIRPGAELTQRDASSELGFDRAGLGLWTSVVAGDFNEDGRPDYLLGNIGLNTPYQGTKGAPDVAYLGDFKGGGAPLLVEGYTFHGTVVPRRTRAEFVARLPALARRYPQTDAFARATLDELLTPEKRAAARSWQVTEVNSGILLSQPDGRWTFSALPRETQLAPTQGAVVGDFNHDGHADVVLAQNSHAPAPFYGRFTGGLGQLLLGDGRGGLLPIDPVTSGVRVTGDAKAVVITGSPEEARILVSRNQAPGVSLVITTPRTLAVHLIDPAPAGAVVLLQEPGTPPQRQELYLNNGYMSQAEPILRFTRQGNATALLTVRWPDGRETRQEVAGDRSTVAVRR